MPPLDWINGKQDMQKKERDEAMKNPLKISISFNNIEWEPTPDFKFLEHKIKRLAYANEFMAEWGDIEQREKKWNEEEPEEDDPQGKNDKDTAKLMEAKMKEIMQKTIEIQSVARVKDYRMYIVGTDFEKTP